MWLIELLEWLEKRRKKREKADIDRICNETLMEAAEKGHELGLTAIEYIQTEGGRLPLKKRRNRLVPALEWPENSGRDSEIAMPEWFRLLRVDGDEEAAQEALEQELHERSVRAAEGMGLTLGEYLATHADARPWEGEGVAPSDWSGISSERQAELKQEYWYEMEDRSADLIFEDGSLKPRVSGFEDFIEGYLDMSEIAE